MLSTAEDHITDLSDKSKNVYSFAKENMPSVASSANASRATTTASGLMKIAIVVMLVTIIFVIASEFMP
jgi:hypothetical protein